MFRLRSRHVYAPLARSCLLLSRRACRDSTLAAVIAYAIYDCLIDDLIDDGRVVNVPHIRYVDIVDGAVVVEAAITPIAALVAVPVITVSVVDTAIKSDFWTPVAWIPPVRAIRPTPVAWRPQVAGFRRHHPRPGDPVIAIIVIPGPVAWRPDIAITRTCWLLVNRKFGWGEVNRDHHLPERGTDDEEGKQKRQHRTFNSHVISPR